MFKAYTNEEIAEHARQFSTRAEWRAAGELERQAGNASHYGAALHRGRGAMRQYCGHMQSGMVGNQHGLKYSDEELVDLAKQFQHKSDWKKSNSGAYQMAIRRPGVFDRAVAHMTPKSNPYSGSYVIYAYEFTDRHAYVGLTFLPKTRYAQHMCRGPVFDHLKICPTFTYKIVEEGLANPSDTQAAEGKWQSQYATDGWTALHSAKAGGLGAVSRGKWTKEAVLAKAKEFTTRKGWYLGNQFTYSLAKREGWFEEAVAHMPRRVLGIGMGQTVSAETREKQRQAKLGVRQTASARRARSTAIREWWNASKNPCTPDKAIPQPQTFRGVIGPR